MSVPDNARNLPAVGDQDSDGTLQPGPEERDLASIPAATPTHHLQIGPHHEFADDPVVGSVMADDWGPIPGVEADLEEGETWVFHDDAVI